MEVGNPSELFLAGDGSSPGTATIVACEGTRSLLVEIQALVSPTSYASPRRTATGIGTNRLHQILAVLEKHMGLPLSRFDCYLAVAGGLQVEEPAADLGVAAAVVASYRDLILPAGTVLLGELGLGGPAASRGPAGTAPAGGRPAWLHPGGAAAGQRPGGGGGRPGPRSCWRPPPWQRPWWRGWA